MITPVVLNKLAGAAGPYIRRQAETFADAAGKLGITGLNVTQDAGRVIVTVPYEAAVAQYGGGVSMPSSWVEHAALDVGGHLG